MPNKMSSNLAHFVHFTMSVLKMISNTVFFYS